MRDRVLGAAERKRGRRYYRRPLDPWGKRLQVLLVGLDHLLDHLAAHGTGLAGGQVAVVAFLQVDANLP